MTETQNAIEKALAQALMLEGAGKSCTMLDSFSGWILGGFAAAITLLITQFASLSKYLSPSIIRYCLILFAVSVVIALIAKYISVVILGSVQSSTVSREIVTKEPFYQHAQTGLNFEVVFSEMEHAILPPMRWFVRRSFEKFRQGDITASARTFLFWVQIQGYLVFLQVVLLLWTISVILLNFKLTSSP